MSVSIVTPWHNHAELIPEYERAVQGADDFSIVANGCNPIVYRALMAMCKRIGGMVLPHLNDKPFSFAEACNYGMAWATGDIVVMLNNDITAVPGWLGAVARDVLPGALYGPATGVRVVAGQPMVYLEGWCVAAHRETWDALGGFDAETFQRPYWEDVDLSWRATQQGIRLLRRPWMVTHLGNVTSSTTPGAYDASDANRRAFERKVMAARVLA